MKFVESMIAARLFAGRDRPQPSRNKAQRDADDARVGETDQGLQIAQNQTFRPDEGWAHENKAHRRKQSSRNRRKRAHRVKATPEQRIKDDGKIGARRYSEGKAN